MLKVSENRRFLVSDSGKPFFYLGDTAWNLFVRLTREQARRYLDNRAFHRFSVVQAVVLAEANGLETPNVYGDLPFFNLDSRRVNEAYFSHIDHVVAEAAKRGLYMAMLPTWGDKVELLWGDGPAIFSPEYNGQGLEAAAARARDYGLFLGRRYHDADNIIWVLGGDRTGKYPEVWTAMAEGLASGDGGAHLKTFHPKGGKSSSEWFHDSSWLDFNMFQTSHGARYQPNYRTVAADYAKSPAKPCMDGEPPYEQIPVDMKPQNGFFDDFDVRLSAYWSVFAGACGYTYGANPVWQMCSKKYPGHKQWTAVMNWHEALNLCGAVQMKYLRALVESRPFFERIPDQSLVCDNIADGYEYVAATRSESGSYAFLYIPTGKPVKVATACLSGERLRVWWYDPRTGRAANAGEVEKSAVMQFTPPGVPGRGGDWVLVLDDASFAFHAPGSVS